MSTCQHFGGIYIGDKPKAQISVTDNERREFVDIFYKGLSNGLYPLKVTGNDLFMVTLNVTRK
jgi:hypothetical protein